MSCCGSRTNYEQQCCFGGDHSSSVRKLLKYFSQTNFLTVDMRHVVMSWLCSPSRAPTPHPTRLPSRVPSVRPTRAPTFTPTRAPSRVPTFTPTFMPTSRPTSRSAQSIHSINFTLQLMRGELSCVDRPRTHRPILRRTQPLTLLLTQPLTPLLVLRRTHHPNPRLHHPRPQWARA